MAQPWTRQHQRRPAVGECSHRPRSSPHFPQRAFQRVVPSSGPLFYQPDPLLLKCSKNSVRYPNLTDIRLNVSKIALPQISAHLGKVLVHLRLTSVVICCPQPKPLCLFPVPTGGGSKQRKLSACQQGPRSPNLASRFGKRSPVLPRSWRKPKQPDGARQRRFECFHFPWVDLPADLLVGDLLFSIDSSSSADDGGGTSPWSTIAFASTAFP
jgi:hypothetical protein